MMILQLVRPYCVAAVLRGVTFTPESYKSFIDLQDKLHQNLCRHRRLVAIGTHDLDTLKPPFRYRGLPPRNIRFQPLSQDREWQADELLEFYETDPSVKHLKEYPQIIKDKPVYPVIVDAADTVLSLPPIINGEHSKIKLSTTNIFIECTAVDLTKANVVLNTVVTMFSEYCAVPLTAEAVSVSYADPAQCPSAPYLTPNLDTFEMGARMSVLNATASISIEATRAASLASRMGLSARVGDGGNSIVCSVPPTRSDILHECDVIEDVAIAYGFNNIKPRIPSTPTCAAPLPINLLTDKLRGQLAQMGFWEVLTTVLISRRECFDAMNLVDDDSCVVLANPKAESFQVARKSLLPGILKSMASNKALPSSIGQRYYDVSDVVLLDDTTDTGARNERRLAAAYFGPTAGFEIIQGVMERVMSLLEVPRRWKSGDAAMAAGAIPVDASPEDVAAALRVTGRGGFAYRVDEAAHPSYFPGRCGRIVLIKDATSEAASASASADGAGDASAATGGVTEVDLGMFGMIHPDVLGNFDVDLPSSALEINVAPFLEQK